MINLKDMTELLYIHGRLQAKSCANGAKPIGTALFVRHISIHTLCKIWIKRHFNPGHL